MRERNPRVHGWKLVQPEPDSEPMMMRLVGIPPDDPACGMILMQVYRARQRGEDISDRQVIARCVMAGRRIVAKRQAEIELAERTSCIYYVRVGEYIKIGTAMDLRTRLRAYPPGSQLLASEPGSYQKEAERLAEFGEYLAARKEWFRPGPRLMEHIAAIQGDDTPSSA